MAVARTNPLPNGFYWIDLFSPTPSSPTTRPGPPAFLSWVASNRGKVAVIRTEEFSEPGFGGPARTWILFKVDAPPGAFPFGLGFPTIAAGPNVTSEDTADVQHVETPDLLSSFGTVFQGVEGLVLLFVLYQLSKGRR